MFRELTDAELALLSDSEKEVRENGFCRTA